MLPRIAIILAGRTIDSIYDPDVETRLVDEKNSIIEYFESLQLYINFSFHLICQDKYKNQFEPDKKKIFELIKSSNFNKFLIFHGQETISETARYLQKNSDGLNEKTVILTTSIKPLEDVVISDAPFNLGFAVSSCLNLDPGIYVTLNGSTFKPQNLHIKKCRLISNKF